jgi:hypothetical protein
MATAAHVSFIHPDMRMFNRLALSLAVLAALAWRPGPQIGEELSFLLEPLCAAAVTPKDAARPIGSSVPISSEAFAECAGEAGDHCPSHLCA